VPIDGSVQTRDSVEMSFLSALRRALRAFRAATFVGVVGCGPSVQILYPHPETPRSAA
jgi:hypothetical protein